MSESSEVVKLLVTQAATAAVTFLRSGPNNNYTIDVPVATIDALCPAAAASSHASTKFETEESLTLRDFGLWERWSHASVETAEIAVDTVRRCVLSTRCSDDDVDGVSRVAARTFMVKEKPVLLHVWASRKEARRFHEGFKMLAQLKFEHMVPAPLQVPVSALVGHLGRFVSVIWLPPLTSALPTKVEPGSPLGCIVDILRAALGLVPGSPLPVYMGANLLLYAVCPLEATQLRIPVGTNRTSLVRPVVYTSLPTRLRDPFSHIVNQIVPQVAQTVLNQLRSDLTAATAVQLVASGAMGDELKKQGAPVACLGLLALYVGDLMGTTAQQVSPNALDVIRGEMVSRSVKHLIIESLASLKYPAYSTADIVEMLQLETAQAVLGKFLSSNDYFEENVMPVVVSKFGLMDTDKRLDPTRLKFTRSNVKSVLAGVIFAAGNGAGLRMELGQKSADEFKPSGLVMLSSLECPPEIVEAVLQRTSGKAVALSEQDKEVREAAAKRATTFKKIVGGDTVVEGDHYAEQQLAKAPQREIKCYDNFVNRDTSVGAIAAATSRLLLRCFCLCEDVKEAAGIRTEVLRRFVGRIASLPLPAATRKFHILAMRVSELCLTSGRYGPELLLPILDPSDTPASASGLKPSRSVSFQDHDTAQSLDDAILFDMQSDASSVQSGSRRQSFRQSPSASPRVNGRMSPQSGVSPPLTPTGSAISATYAHAATDSIFRDDNPLDCLVKAHICRCIGLLPGAGATATAFGRQGLRTLCDAVQLWETSKQDRRRAQLGDVRFNDWASVVSDAMRIITLDTESEMLWQVLWRAANFRNLDHAVWTQVTIEAAGTCFNRYKLLIQAADGGNNSFDPEITARLVRRLAELQLMLSINTPSRPPPDANEKNIIPDISACALLTLGKHLPFLSVAAAAQLQTSIVFVLNWAFPSASRTARKSETRDVMSILPRVALCIRSAMCGGQFGEALYAMRRIELWCAELLVGATDVAEIFEQPSRTIRCTRNAVALWRALRARRIKALPGEEERRRRLVALGQDMDAVLHLDAFETLWRTYLGERRATFLVRQWVEAELPRRLFLETSETRERSVVLQEAWDRITVVQTELTLRRSFQEGKAPSLMGAAFLKQKREWTATEFASISQERDRRFLVLLFHQSVERFIYHVEAKERALLPRRVVLTSAPVQQQQQQEAKPSPPSPEAPWISPPPVSAPAQPAAAPQPVQAAAPSQHDEDLQLLVSTAFTTKQQLQHRCQCEWDRHVLEAKAWTRKAQTFGAEWTSRVELLISFEERYRISTVEKWYAELGVLHKKKAPLVVSPLAQRMFDAEQGYRTIIQQDQIVFRDEIMKCFFNILGLLESLPLSARKYWILDRDCAPTTYGYVEGLVVGRGRGNDSGAMPLEEPARPSRVELTRQSPLRRRLQIAPASPSAPTEESPTRAGESSNSLPKPKSVQRAANRYSGTTSPKQAKPETAAPAAPRETPNVVPPRSSTAALLWLDTPLGQSIQRSLKARRDVKR